MYDLNQKTIFVLDHTQYFSISSEDYIPLDFLKGKTGAAEPLMASAAASGSGGLQFSKSLWTCSVESSIEYCRIVWDLFPRGKLIRFIVSDTAAHIVNTWKFATQNMSHVLNAMALVGVPQRNAPQSSDYSVIHGLRAAIEALAEPTEQQISSMQVQEHSGINNEKIPNKGRVICITSARDNPSMKSLEDIFHNVLMQQNTLAMAQKKLLNIDHCHLVIINMVPMDIETLVTNRSKMELSPCLSTEIHTTCAPEISNKLTHLIMSHYDLASTTVTGIPMKEEQNANSSANYDVEILHAKNAHTAICGNETLLPTSIKEGAEYETVTLKWCTPRGCGASDMSACPPCLAQHRVTPVDVTSRPSSCLINFLLNGRSVLLEMPRKTGGKTTSHLLSARGGEIFIHALQITRSCLEDPPSISEGPGGRIADYRITDFAAFIKAHRFLPLKSKQKSEENLHRARERLYARSPYFPLTLSTTMVFNLQRNVHWLPNFLRKIAKDDMDKADEIQCQQNIYELYTASTRKELLPFPNLSANRIKGHKKIDQYKLLCAELEILIKGCATTPYHKVVLESIQNVRAACGDSTVKSETDLAQALPPVHVPITLGNNFFILTQQDVRKIEDTRQFSVSKIALNGSLISVTAQDTSNWLQQSKQENLNQNINNLLEVSISKNNNYQECQQQLMSRFQEQNCSLSYPQPMDVTTTECENHIVASIEQQLQWNKYGNISVPFPMTYSHGTSTTEINYKEKEVKDQQNIHNATCNCCEMCQQCGSSKYMCNKSTNTQELQSNCNQKSNEVLDAREQLKKKKLSYSFSYII